MSFSIAIDGPAGAGKSTIAKKVAKELGFIYVDTGAMYRAIAFYFKRNHTNVDDCDESGINEILKGADISIRHENGEQQVILNEENVNAFLRTEEIGKLASLCAKSRPVRLKLVELQRKLSKTADVIMDGRDIGTYVLPDADIKIYLTASVEERAKRRFEELKGKGISCNLKEIEDDIVARDEQDMNREFAPLKKAVDAILVDTSYMNIEQAKEEVIRLYQEKRSK